MADGGYAFAYSDTAVSTACIDSNALCTTGTTVRADSHVYVALRSRHRLQPQSGDGHRRGQPPVNAFTATGVGLSYSLSAFPAEGCASRSATAGTTGADYCAILTAASGTVAWAKFNTAMRRQQRHVLDRSAEQPHPYRVPDSDRRGEDQPSTSASSRSGSRRLCRSSTPGVVAAGRPCVDCGPSSASAGSPELTCYDFAQGTVNDKTFCGYQGTETSGNNTGAAPAATGVDDTVPNVANPAVLRGLSQRHVRSGQRTVACASTSAMPGSTIMATMVDECATCPTTGHIDLSLSAAIALNIGVGSSIGDVTNASPGRQCPVR